MIVRLKMILNEITNISENMSLGKNNPKKIAGKIFVISTAIFQKFLSEVCDFIKNYPFFKLQWELKNI